MGVHDQSCTFAGNPLYCRWYFKDEERAAQYRQLFSGYLDECALKKIRKSVNKGLALGNDQFRMEIEGLTGRRVTALKRGPKSGVGVANKKEEPEFLL